MTLLPLFKKFCLGCKNLDGQVKSGRCKTVYESFLFRICFLAASCVGNELRGNPFALFEMGVRNQYTQAEGRFLSHCQFQVLSTGQIPILSMQLTLSHRLLTPNR